MLGSTCSGEEKDVLKPESLEEKGVPKLHMVGENGRVGGERSLFS